MNQRIHYAVEELFEKAEKAQTAGSGMVDWIVDAVSIEIQRLRTLKTGGTHPNGVDLGESSLLWVVVAVDGVVEAGIQATVVAGEPPVG